MRVAFLILVVLSSPVAAEEPLSRQILDSETSARLMKERSALVSAVQNAMQELDAQEVRRIGYRAKVIYLIRNQRLLECTDLLLANLEERDPISGGIGPLAGLPAAETLVELGSPIYREVFEKWIEHPRSENQLLIVACVMVAIDGPRLATIRLEEALEARPNGFDYEGLARDKMPRAKNLRSLLEYVKIDFSNPKTSPLMPRWSNK